MNPPRIQVINLHPHLVDISRISGPPSQTYAGFTMDLRVVDNGDWTMHSTVDAIEMGQEYLLISKPEYDRLSYPTQQT